MHIHVNMYIYIFYEPLLYVHPHPPLDLLGHLDLTFLLAHLPHATLPQPLAGLGTQLLQQLLLPLLHLLWS